MRRDGFAISIALVCACGGGDDAPPDAAPVTCRNTGGAACFQLPTAPMTNRDGMPSALGCGPIVPTPAPTAVTITGTVEGFGTGTPIPGGDIRLYTAADFATPFATATGQADSTYSIQIPTGTPDLQWGTVSGTGYLTSYVHGYRPDLTMGDIADFGLTLFLPDNLEGAAVLVEEVWDPTYQVAAGFVYDCDRFVVVHAAVVVSSAAGTRAFVPPASLYYGAPGAVPIAVPPEQRGDTNDNGAFAVFRVPPGQLFVQAWGFPDAAAMAQGEAGLVLVAEHPLEAVANTVAPVNVWVNR